VTADDGALDLDLIAASLRADGADLSAFVESLAVKLEQVLPGKCKVERRRDGLLVPKVVHRITVDAGDRRLELRVAGGTIETLSAKLSGGIVLKSDSLDTDTWLAALGEALGAEAQRSESTRQALERLLMR
jgi:hypothetical protein